MITKYGEVNITEDGVSIKDFHTDGGGDINEVFDWVVKRFNDMGIFGSDTQPVIEADAEEPCPECHYFRAVLILKYCGTCGRKFSTA